MKFGRLRAAALCGALAVVVSISAVKASTLVDQGQNTYDPNTKLLWLDVSLTTNISYNTMLANLSDPSYPYFGYRYATVAEISTLYTDAGISPVPYTASLTPSSAIANLITLLGSTSPNDEEVYVLGRTGDPFDASFQIMASLMQLVGNGLGGGPPVTNRYLAFPDGGNVVNSFDGILPGGGPQIGIGSFLVADATPLPAALPLFVTGLGALGLLGWRRKRKAVAA